MRKLLAIEWMKLRRLNTMKVILIIYAVLVPAIYLLLKLVNLNGWTFPDDTYEFPMTYRYITFISSYFNLMIGVIIIVFTTNELKYKTQRQNVIDGLSKRDVIMAKFYVVILMSLIVTLYAFVVSFIFGLIGGGEAGVFDGIEQIGVYFISTIGYFAFAFFFANLVKMPALAIIFYLLSTTIEGILGFVALQEYVQFFPLSTFSNLVPNPLEIGGPPEMRFIWDQTSRTLLAVGYISIMVSISYWVIRRRDI